MGLRIAMVAGVLGCAVAGVTGMAQSQQQEQQSSSHLGQVAKRHGGLLRNPRCASCTAELLRHTYRGCGRLVGDDGVPVVSP